MSILAFGDLHMGLKAGYSSQLDSGFVSSEAEAIKAMNHIIERSKRDDIDMIVCTGDVTHTNHPTSLVAQQIVDWIIQLDRIGKPVFFITGNHDLSTYSHSFDYITPLISRGLVKNINICDSGVTSIDRNKYKMFFVPFVWGESTEKYKTVQDQISDILSVNQRNTIIVSHFQESDSVSGSEAAMISKSTEKFDLDSSAAYFENVHFILGHIHQYQKYTKKNGINVCYTGNPYYHDKTDCNKQKGYVVIDDNMNISFEAIPNLIKFYKYIIPIESDPETYFSNTRMFPNSVAFVENHIESETDSISDYALSKILNKYNVILADISNVVDDQNFKIISKMTSIGNFNSLFRETLVDNYKENPFSDDRLKEIFNVGDELLAEAGYKE